jgi:hypothetical protein
MLFRAGCDVIVLFGEDAGDRAATFVVNYSKIMVLLSSPTMLIPNSLVERLVEV